VADLAGQPVSVDDPGNGFALALREMMRHHGLSPHDVRWELAGGTDRRYAALMEGRHAATMLRAPFDLMAQANGFRRLATTRETIGPYLGIVGAARRSWAANHEVSLVAFIRAYRDAVRWLKQPTNREDACRLLIQHQPQMSAPLAAEACAVLLDPLTGFFDDVRLDAAGVQAVIDLRAGSLPTGRSMREPLNCVDDRFWRLA
jgi:ABC-type nitrate/sulfonate/bicarbonate transport system substrate-binding protein